MLCFFRLCSVSVLICIFMYVMFGRHYWTQHLAKSKHINNLKLNKHDIKKYSKLLVRGKSKSQAWSCTKLCFIWLYYLSSAVEHKHARTHIFTYSREFHRMLHLVSGLSRSVCGNAISTKWSVASVQRLESRSELSSIGILFLFRWCCSPVCFFLVRRKESCFVFVLSV